MSSLLYTDLSWRGGLYGVRVQQQQRVTRSFLLLDVKSWDAAISAAFVTTNIEGNTENVLCEDVPGRVGGLHCVKISLGGFPFLLM